MSLIEIIIPVAVIGLIGFALYAKKRADQEHAQHDNSASDA